MCFSKQPVKGEVCNHANFYQISKYGYSVTVESDKLVQNCKNVAMFCLVSNSALVEQYTHA